MRKIRLKHTWRMIVDGIVDDSSNLKDMALIYEFLNDCPLIVGVRKLMPPYVFKYEGKQPNDWGYSGFVLIIGGGYISIHTFPEKSSLSFDFLIFGRRKIDIKPIETYIRKFFDGRLKVRILDRN